MDMPVDYHVHSAMLDTMEYMPKLANIMLSWKIVLSMIQNDLLHKFIDKATVSFCNRFRSCVAATGGH